MKSEGPIDWPTKDILRCIFCKEFIKYWAINNDVTKFVKKVGVNSYIYYNRTVKKMVVSARDFVTNMI